MGEELDLFKTMSVHTIDMYGSSTQDKKHNNVQLP